MTFIATETTGKPAEGTFAFVFEKKLRGGASANSLDTHQLDLISFWLSSAASLAMKP